MKNRQTVCFNKDCHYNDVNKGGDNNCNKLEYQRNWRITACRGRITPTTGKAKPKGYPFKEGVMAFVNGEKFNDNPYFEHSVAADLWQYGYLDAGGGMDDDQIQKGIDNAT